MKSLRRAGEISVPELAEQVGTSSPSIRHDLARLEKRGLVLRTHGGAALVEPLFYTPFRYDTSFQARELRSADEKRRIGLAAAELIKENEIVGLTAGTTTTQIGRSLRHRRGVCVVTNAVNIGMELSNQPAIKTMITGGTLAWALAFALAGQTALRFLQEIYLDKAFISATGVDIERGVTTLEQEEAAVAITMMRQAKQVILVADSSKFGHVSSAVICPIASMHILVTDTGLSEPNYQALTSRGIQVIRA
jgi:DeoR family transcriptional regulator of aga operon